MFLQHILNLNELLHRLSLIDSLLVCQLISSYWVVLELYFTISLSLEIYSFLQNLLVHVFKQIVSFGFQCFEFRFCLLHLYFHSCDSFSLSLAKSSEGLIHCFNSFKALILQLLYFLCFLFTLVSLMVYFVETCSH